MNKTPLPYQRDSKKQHFYRWLLAMLALFCVTLGIAYYQSYRFEQKAKAEEARVKAFSEENKQGICIETKTNLFETLGRQAFFELAKKHFLEEKRRYMSAHTSKHHAICERMKCGLYLLAKDANQWDSVLAEYRHRMQETAVSMSMLDLEIFYREEGIPKDPSMLSKEEKKGNIPVKILTDVALEQIDLRKPIQWTEGIFLEQTFRSGRIYRISKNAQNNLFTLQEMVETDKKSEDSYWLKEHRSRGWDNFFMRYEYIWLNQSPARRPMQPVPVEDSLKKENSGFEPISNCGDVHHDNDI